MKIAIPKNGELINQHFGKSENFEIITIENNKIVESKVISTAELKHNHKGLSDLLFNEEVSLVITGGIGKGALDGLKEKHFEVIRGASGKIDDIVNLYLNGSLKDKEVVCNHHGEHNHNNLL